jgi:hypothetical protein
MMLISALLPLTDLQRLLAPVVSDLGNAPLLAPFNEATDSKTMQIYAVLDGVQIYAFARLL